MTPGGSLIVLLVVVLGLLITQVVRIEITALLTIVALALTGILSPSEAFLGFSSPATITVAAMLVMSAGVERSGAMDVLAGRLVQLGARGEMRLMFALLVPTAVLSAFLNNTPIVALMIPVTLALARRTGIAPSRMLLPLSYVSILAGTCTLIGTSTNILVDSLYRERGGEGFEMFEFGGLGMIYLALGGLYVLIVGPRVLPKRTALSEFLPATGGDRFVTVVTVPAESSLVGKDLESALRGADEMAVIEVVRDEVPHMKPGKGFTLVAGDTILLEGTARSIHGLIARKGVEAGTALVDDHRVTISRVDLRIAEAVVTPTSSFRHRRVRDLGLSRRFGVLVLALRRLGRQHQYKLGSLRIHSGDVLLVQGEPSSLRTLEEDGDLLLVQGVQSTLTEPKKAPLALGIVVAVVLLAALGVAPISILGVLGAAVMIVTRCLDVAHATRALETSVLFLLAATIPLGVAMEKVGLAATIAGSIGHIGGDFGVFALVGLVYLITSLLTEVLSNNASAALLVPIALATAQQIGIDPKPLLVAITFGASASFATPIGYQTNTLVMGPGGYLFKDYVKFGAPLNVLMAVVATALIPVFWPS